MQRPVPAIHGIVGGLLAGAVVALWFFVVDAASSTYFFTPTKLATAVLGHESTLSIPRLVAVYTLLHFSVFALLGLGATYLFRVTPTSPGILTGALFGIGVLSAVHYGALLLVGEKILPVLPVGHVLAANVIGGIAMMLYVHRATHEDRPFGFAALKGHALLIDGLIYGAIGAGAVALWFLMLDVLASQPFHTPAALGSALLLGAQSAAEIRVTPGIIFAYTAVHLGTFFLVGVGVAWLVRVLERAPNMWLMGLLVLIMLEALFFGVVGSLGEWVLGAIGLWAVAVGNVLAVLAMGARIWSTRPALRQQLTHLPAQTRV
jgi:hypothetical protein